MASIVDEIRNNREKGAKLLESEYKAGLMSLARRFCANESDAEELVNRTFAIVVEKIDSYLEQSAFFGWMSRILINCHSKDIRRKSNELEFCDAILPEEAPDDDACARIFREVDASILRDAIDRLSPEMKQTLLLHYFMDMPVREVAKVLSVPSGTIKWRLHYARQILAAKIGKTLKKPVVALVAAGLFMLASAAVVIANVEPKTDKGEYESTDAINKSASVVYAASNAPDSLDGGSIVDDPLNPLNSQHLNISSQQPLNISTKQGENPMKKKLSIVGSFRKLMNVCTAIMFANVAQLNAEPSNDGYIESDGRLGFNTSYYVGPNTKLELDFQLTSLVANTNGTGYTDLNERLMAIESPYDVSSYATTLPRFIVYLGFYDNKPKLSFKGSAADGSPQARNLYDADLGRHTMVIDLPASSDHFKVFTDGVQTFASGNTYGAFLQKTATIPLALFGETECSNPDRSGNTFPNRPQLGYSYQNRSKMRIFGFKCYEKENGEYVLKRNFVPCLKGGVPGFKDEVSGYFFTGENVDTVKYGGNIMVVKDDPYLSTGPYNSVAKAAAAGECIYIDTGYYPKTTSRIELDFAPLTPNSWTSSTKYAHDTEFLYAEHSSGTYYAFEIDGMNNHGYIGVKVGNADHRYVARLCDAYNIRRTISLSSNSVVMVVSGCTNYVSVITTPGYGFLADSETTLRIVSSSATGNYFSPMKVYGLKIYESDVLIKDLRPTVTNGVSCLVDACNPANVCYTTPYGGDTHRLMFEAGGNIACTDGSDEAYLEFRGSGNIDDFIDTGCIVSNDSRIDVDLSLWDAYNVLNSSDSGQQFLLWQEPNIGSGVAAYLYTSPAKFFYRLSDCTAQSGLDTGISASNDRRQFTFDGLNGKFTVRKGGEVELDIPMGGTRTLSNGGSVTLKIGNKRSRMRLYSFKATTNGNVVRDFVPCVTNGVAGLYDLAGSGFYPLAGGKVSGKGTKDKDEFIVRPQPMRIARKDGMGTLTCLAIGAQSYEWYEDGVLMEGETSDALTIEWLKTKAKPSKHTYTYSVKPVYTVFNETVRGEEVTVQVEFIPLGTIICVQ